MKRVLMLLTLAILPWFAFSQLTLSGRVSGEDSSQPLAGAHVILVNTYNSTATDAEGHFIFRNLKPGEYSVRVSFLGFETHEQKIRVSQPVELEIKLKPTAILEDEVVIRATRASAGSPVTSQEISLEEIRQQNLGKDLPYLVENSLSAVASSDAGNGMGYTALRIRGTDMTRINVTVNGIPLNDPESHNVFWVDLPDFASSTNHIQVQRGVGSSTNGAASFGASINLQSTVMNPEPYTEFSGAYGSFNTGKATLKMGTGLMKNNWIFEGRISGLSSDGYIDRASSSMKSWFLSGGYTSKNNLLRATVFSGTEKTYQAWDGIPSYILDTNRTWNGMGAYYDNNGNLQYYRNETDNYTQTHFQLHYAHRFSSSFTVNAAAHYTHGAGYYEQFKEDDDFSGYGIEPIRLASPYYVIGTDTVSEPDSLVNSCDIIRRKNLDNDFYGLTWSLEYRRPWFGSTLGGSWNQYNGRHFGTLVWMQFASSSFPGDEWYRSTGDKSDFNVFSKNLFHLNYRLSLMADLQLRHIYYRIRGIDDDLRNISQQHPFTFFNPKAGLNIKIDGRQEAYVFAGISNREPNRDNFVDANPEQPAPKRETLYDGEAGYSYASTRFSMRTNFFYMYYRDQLALTGAINDVGAPVMVNVPESYRTGLETAISLRLLSSLDWNLNLTLSRNRISSFTEYVDNWDDWSQVEIPHTHTDLAFSPAVIAGSELSWKPAEQLLVNLSSKFIGRQYIDNTGEKSRSLDQYFDNRLLVSYLVKAPKTDEVRFTLQVNNLFNNEYETNAWVYRYFYEGSYREMNGYFPQAGVHFMLGMTVRL